VVQPREGGARSDRGRSRPIEADVRAALERYARSHGIDLVLDRHKLGDLVLVVADSADITTAFIKDYNARSKPSAR
jgi:Skp family chaperone for outer membrane proteins